MADLVKKTAELLDRLRERKPMIHHITNMVVMNDTANATLHIGGMPVMSHAREEVGEMVSAASALVLNPGTLTSELIESMLIAGKRANESGIPIVLDPVGAGATKLRTDGNHRLLKELKVAIVRGNSGEIGALTGLGGVVRGVDSLTEVTDPVRVTKTMAERYRVTAVITSARDVVSDGRRVAAVEGGDAMLKTITGSGCMATTMIASFTAVEKDHLVAAVAGLTCYKVAAESAARVSRGPASFKVALLDGIYNLSSQQVLEDARAFFLEET